MLFKKLKVATAVLLVVTLVRTGGGVVHYRLQAAPAGDAKKKITPANVSELQELTRIDKEVHEIVWSPDGKQLAFVGWEKPVEILDAKSLRSVATIGADKKIIAFAFSRDRDVVAFCENSTRAEILNRRTKKSIEIETENDQPGMVFSPDGKFLATGGYGTTAKIWSVSSGELIRSLDVGGVVGGLTVVFSPDGKTIAVGNRNSTTRLFEVATGNLLHTLDKEMSQELKFDPKGERLAVAYVDGSVGIWDVATGNVLDMTKTDAKEVYTLDWSPSGEVLATAGLESKITLWNPKDLSVLKELESPEWVIRVRFSPDGTRLFTPGGGQAASSEDRKVVVWGLR